MLRYEKSICGAHAAWIFTRTIGKGDRMDEENQAYTNFAQVYDLFMDNVPYEEWGQYIADLLQGAGITDGILLDLGCGTGKLTRFMAELGYDMIGVDHSLEMLEIARESGREQMAVTESGDGLPEDPVRNILYLQQDMRAFELYGTVRAIYSACDSINYILEESELLQVFRLVNNYLDPKGLFLFDCNTPYKYEQLLGENTFAENREACSFIWENYYDSDRGINEYDLTLYIRNSSGYYQRFEETHFQKSYSLDVIRKLLAAAGLEFVAAYDAYTREEPAEDCERFLVIAREHGK